MPRLSDVSWERIPEHFPENVPDGRTGRKPVTARQVLDAVLWTDAVAQLTQRCDEDLRDRSVPP